MHVQTFHIDDVFDVVAKDGYFSFRSAGRTHYGVRLQRHLIPRQGSTYAVAFVEPGNWETVLGWRDLASDDVGFARPTAFWWQWALGDIAVYGLFVLLGGLLLNGAGGTLVVVAVCSCMAAYQVRFNGKVKRVLGAAAVARPA